MNHIRDLLQGGNPRSLGQTERVVTWVLMEKERLPELFQCLFDDYEIIRMRASDGLEKVARQEATWFLPYTERLLTDVAAIQQPSVQWHLAQILGEIPLTAEQELRAISLLKRNLEQYQDWIVVKLSLEALTKFARQDSALSKDFLTILMKYKDSPKKSIASRVHKLLPEFS